MNYHRGQWKKWADLVGDVVPAVDVALGVYNVAERVSRPNTPFVPGGHPAIEAVPWQFPGPPAHPGRVEDVLRRLSGLLAIPPGSAQAGGRMRAIDALLRSIPPVELDAVVVRLGPQGLGALNAAFEESVGGEWTSARAQSLLNVLLEHVSPYAVGVLGCCLPCCQPELACAKSSSGGDGWVLPAGPLVVFDDKAYRGDGGQRVEASVAPLAWQDVLQGSLGDCWFLTSLQAVAKANPGFLPGHVRQNPNGTISVMLYSREDRSPCPVTMVPDLPAMRPERLFGASGHVRDPAYAELWPAYYEKALAQAWGCYCEIEGGRGEWAFRLITGRETVPLATTGWVAREVCEYLRRGHAVAVGTKGGSDRNRTLGGRLVCGHEYFVKDVDPVRGAICLGNPWGDGADRGVWECWLTDAEVAEHVQELVAVWPW